MRYALNLSEDGRILSATFEQYATEGMPIVDVLPDGDISDYLYHNGEYISDPLPEPEKPKESDSYDYRISEVEKGNTEIKETIDALLGVTE